MNSARTSPARARRGKPSVRSVAEEVLPSLRPVGEGRSRFLKEAHAFTRRIRGIAQGLGASAVLGGSAAKGTWLKGDMDIDIFVCFGYQRYSERSSSLSGVLGRALRPLRPERVPGSRDYFQIRREGFVFEIVPVLGIQGARQARNVTDVSLLHTKWVSGRIGKNKGLADEIRLAKAFCKAHRCYGAESYVRGFSGYACEVLTLHYGSFQGLLRGAARWREKQLVDASGFYRRKNVFAALNTAKLESPLILIDPVQPDRNIAAALSRENFIAFRRAASAFLKAPSAAHFVQRKVSYEGLRKRHRERLVFLRLLPKGAKRDVQGANAMKCFELAQKALDPFGLERKGWEFGEEWAEMWFVPRRLSLPGRETVQGPPVGLAEHARRFRAKYRRAYVRKGILFAERKRQVSSCGDALLSVLGSDVFLERARRVEVR